MRITALTYDSRKNHMLISTDGGRDFVLGFEDYAARKSLYVQGGEISGELLEMTEFLESRILARDKALKTLSYSSKTSKALIRVLTDAGFDGEIAKQTVLSLKKEGYIDEKDFCRRCTDICIAKGYGPVRIRSELIKKGFTQRMIDYTLENTDVDFENLLRTFMSKKKDKNPDYGAIYRYFYSRGYSGGMIADIYHELFD